MIRVSFMGQKFARWTRGKRSLVLIQRVWLGRQADEAVRDVAQQTHLSSSGGFVCAIFE
jgi:hypothetical protein